MLAKADQDSLDCGIDFEKVEEYLSSITCNEKEIICNPKGATKLYGLAERDLPKIKNKQRKSKHEFDDAFSAGGTKKYP